MVRLRNFGRGWRKDLKVAPDTDEEHIEMVKSGFIPNVFYIQ